MFVVLRDRDYRLGRHCAVSTDANFVVIELVQYTIAKSAAGKLIISCVIAELMCIKYRQYLGFTTAFVAIYRSVCGRLYMSAEPRVSS